MQSDDPAIHDNPATHDNPAPALDGEETIDFDGSGGRI
jgi:hypothetical protein